jgi:integrase
MRPPLALDGSAGMNRGRGFCALEARNDFEAVHAWLQRLDGATFRAYRKEAERLIAWAIVERARPLSSLTFEDCIAFRDWLSDPQPAHRWVGPARPRSSPLWRPLRGPLAPRSVAFSVVVLSGLFDFLCSQGYLEANPWRRVPPPRGVRAGLKVSRALSRDAWAAFDGWLQAQASLDADARIAYALVLTLRDTGLRRFELAAADRANCTPYPAAGVWGDLAVVGKGGKERVVTLSARAADALRAHWNDRGASFDDARSGPLVQPLTRPATQRSASRPPEAGYSDSGLHALVVRWAKRFAIASDGTVDLRRLTAHVLRHTFVTFALEDGAAPTAVQATAGHASLATTAIYSHAQDDFRRREVAKTFLSEAP